MSTYLTSLPNDAVKIRGSLDYIDPRGNVYGVERRHNNPNNGLIFVKAQSTVWGYKYCGVSYEDGRHITKRVNRLVAEAFIPNPDNLPVVMHKDNNKKNNRVDNLKWGTIRDNTIQACEDGLIANDKSWDDSQSMPVDQYDTATNILIATYGSVGEAQRKTGIEKGSILFQCRSTDTKIRKATYFVFHGDPPKQHDIVIAYDFVTNEEVGRFANTRLAGEYFGVDSRTVCEHIIKGKPKWSKSGVWFSRIDI